VSKTSSSQPYGGIGNRALRGLRYGTLMVPPSIDPSSSVTESKRSAQPRFGFGQNWLSFTKLVSEEHLAQAQQDLVDMLGIATLEGLSFLDIGSGSGLASLAAYRLGARVHSFDYDLASVTSTEELRRRFGGDDPRWQVEQGSVLDETFMSSLGEFDVVHAWGVLHHTGDMVSAMGQTLARVCPNGLLYLALYNDQGLRSRLWRAVKLSYNRLPAGLQRPFVALVMGPRESAVATIYLLRGRPGIYLKRWTDYRSERGMSKWHDLVDWVGGYPFEVATPDSVFEFYHQRGFTLERMSLTRSAGCNRYILRRSIAAC
jgi:SAM-dependent methyltransferase